MKRAFNYMILLMLVLSMLVPASANSNDESQANDRIITLLEQLGIPGTKIGVPGEMKEWETLQQDYPDAEVIAYNDYPLAYQDVASGRLDAFVYEKLQMELAIAAGTTGVRLLDEPYCRDPVAVAVSPASPIPNLLEKINQFIAELRSDGTLDDMYQRNLDYLKHRRLYAWRHYLKRNHLPRKRHSS